MAEVSGRMVQEGYGSAPVVTMPVYQSRDQMPDFGTWASPFGDVIFKSNAWAEIAGSGQETAVAWFEAEDKLEKKKQNPVNQWKKETDEQINKVTAAWDKRAEAQVGSNEAAQILENRKLRQKDFKAYSADILYSLNQNKISSAEANELIAKMAKAANPDTEDEYKAWKELYYKTGTGLRISPEERHYHVGGSNQ